MPAKKHNFTRTEIMAGALVLGSAIVLAAFVAVIQGLAQPVRQGKEFHATFTNTLGLRTTADVRFGGMAAGKVHDIAPDPEDPTRIRVAFLLNHGVPVNEESVATIEQLSLTAERHLEISVGKPEARRLDDGALVASVTKSGGFIDLPDLGGVVNGSENLIEDLRGLIGVKEASDAVRDGTKDELPSIMQIAEDVRSLLGVKEAARLEAAGERELPSVTRLTGDLRDFLGVQDALEKEAAGDGELVRVADLTANVDELFKKYEPELGAILESVEPVMQSAKNLVDELNDVLTGNRETIEGTLQNVENITGKLNDELEEMVASLESILGNADNISGEAADFLRLNRVILENMLGDLGVTVRNLNTLVNTLKNQPQSVVWGKPQEGRRE